MPAAALAAGSPPPLAAQNPCPDMTAAATLGRAAAPPFGVDKRFGVVDNGGRWGVLDSVWNHRSALEKGLLRPVVADGSEETAVEAEDIGEIAVLRDEGDLVRAANLYDLRDVALRFSPNDDGGLRRRAPRHRHLAVAGGKPACARRRRQHGRGPALRVHLLRGHA